MTQLAGYSSAAFTNSSGLVVAASASVEVRRESDGALASIFSDEAAATPLANPFSADTNGRFAFYAAGLNHGYQVKVTSGADTHTLHNVPIGTGAQRDAADFGASILAAATAAAVAALLDPILSAYASMRNMSIVASVASNALTVALKDRAGSDPSASSPIAIPFRNVTVATGDFSVLSITAASSLVISSGSTLGVANATAFRLWLVGFNDGGTFRLGLVNVLSTTSIMALRDDDARSSTAEGGAGAADSAQVIYTGSAVTSKAIRVLGYLEWSSGLTTAGTWNAVPTKIQLFGPGVPLPADIVQVARNATGAVATGTTVLPGDDTIPQSTEGDQYLSQAITPRSAANVLAVDAMFQGSGSAASGQMTAALFQDSTANALAGRTIAWTGGDFAMAIDLHHELRAGTVSATTFKLRAGGGGAGTTTFNGRASGRLLGGVMASHLTVRELMA